MPKVEIPSRANGVGLSPRSIHHASVTETVLHSFRGYPYDGAHPESGLTYFKGTLYGTTTNGGDSVCDVGLGCGTAFSITPSGTETVLHNFKGLGDGAFPEARLIVLKGALYGTTLQGGQGHYRGGCSLGGTGFGTVFSITPSGQKTIVHEFRRAREGWFPQAALLNVNGIMYGTTCGGGSIHGGDGTAFTITPSGDEHVITSFQLARGAPPSHGRLLDLNGTLYGTASGGGKFGEGVVFSLSTSGREKVLHSFDCASVTSGCSNKDGAYPIGGLTVIKDTLYGTTSVGTSSLTCCGTVFSITPSGTEKVLHSFNYDGDGASPQATLLNVNGTLYGTAAEGGAYGYGTVFSITLSGYVTVLYSFMGGQDGADPQSGLNYVNGTLYGTTYSGGAYDVGTVYSITL